MVVRVGSKGLGLVDLLRRAPAAVAVARVQEAPDGVFDLSLEDLEPGGRVRLGPDEVQDALAVEGSGGREVEASARRERQ